MLIGEVVKSLVVPTKHASLNGVNILLVQIDGKKDRIIAADNIGAGVGDTVLLTTGSHSIARLYPDAAVDAAIIGIF